MPTSGENLSGGFRQSVALARVFLRTQAQLVILDEAMGQMDAIKKRESALPKLLAFAKRQHCTLIVVSHDLPSVCPYVDHVFLLDKGRLVQQGTHADLVSQRAQPYCRLVGMARGGRE